MQVKLVVFDIAGTTVTDDNSVNNAFRGAFEKLGFAVPIAAVNHIMGYRKIEAIKILLQKFYPDQLNNQQLIDDIHHLFINDMEEYYRTAPQLQALPFAEEIFIRLKANDIKIGLDTGFTKSITDIIMQRLGWYKNGLIDVVISSDEVPYGRPHPYMIEAIMNQLSISNMQEVVKVGDTEVDILEGRNAGCGLVISVTTGSYLKEELEQFGPDHIIDSLQELHGLLQLN